MHLKPLRRGWLLPVAVLAALLSADAVRSDSWTRFRGNDASGSSPEKGLPTQWGADQNLSWKIKLPGSGASSPVIVGDKLFVTAYSGYAESDSDPGDKSNLTRHLLCLNKTTGETLWQRDFKSTTPEATYSGFMTQHGYASSTPAVDESSVYLFLGTGGLVALDFDGNERWRKEVGTGTDGWGSAASPIVVDDLVIVNATIEAREYVAFRKTNGEVAWKFKVPGRSWGTPALATSPEGRKELVISAERRVFGLDPASGTELWNCVGIQDYVCPSVTVGQGFVVVAGGRQSAVIAVKTGGSGDVSNTHVLWRKNLGGNVTTPALYGEHLFGVSDRGIAYCVNAQTGETVYESRLASGGGPAGPMPGGRPPGGPGGMGRRPRGGGFGGGGGGGLYASVVVADGKIYAVTRMTGTYVLAAEPEFKVLAHNQLAGDETRFDATPSVADGKLFLRSGQYLYCLGEKPASE